MSFVLVPHEVRQSGLFAVETEHSEYAQHSKSPFHLFQQQSHGVTNRMSRSFLPSRSTIFIPIYLLKPSTMENEILEKVHFVEYSDSVQ